MKTRKMPLSEANNNPEHNTPKLRSTIGLDETCELLALPLPVVTALRSSGMIRADLESTPIVYVLDDVIAVATVLNHYRTHHTEVTVDRHKDKLWESLSHHATEPARNLSSEQYDPLDFEYYSD